MCIIVLPLFSETISYRILSPSLLSYYHYTQGTRIIIVKMSLILLLQKYVPQGLFPLKRESQGIYFLFDNFMYW